MKKRCFDHAPLASQSAAASLPLSVFADSAITANAPKGTVNVAFDAIVSLTKYYDEKEQKNIENSYERPMESWSKAKLVDGNIQDGGWSTNPNEKNTDPDKPVTVTLQLAEEAEVSAVALFPKGYFPAEYTLDVSTDGVTYIQVAKCASEVHPDAPVMHSFPPVRASYVQINVTKRHVSNEGALAQLAEIAVYGKVAPSIRFDRGTLELPLGETDTLTAAVVCMEDAPALTFSSSDDAVVTVDPSGKITAKGIGTANVTVTAGDLTAVCPVSVVETHFDYDDNILLSIFWPPTPSYVTDEQYKLMADAGINWVMGSGEETLRNPITQRKMLALCAKYGMGMTVGDDCFATNVLGKSEAKIAEYASKYKNVPAADGFYLLDEPINPNIFVDAYVALKKYIPNAYLHLNFLPGQVYPSWGSYYSQMYDWCARCAHEGYPVDYLIFDNYPFPTTGDMDRNGFMSNLRICHDVAHAYGVKTGTYIQAIQMTNSRRPSASELRYEMYLCLAFGYKQLSFFTWFTPVDREGPFDDGIISADGVPNEHYEIIKGINKEILVLGETLAKCTAPEVYLNGPETWGQPSIPKSFFVQPLDEKSYTVSALRHKRTGRNYVMVVNNDYDNEQTISLSFDSAVTSLSEVSRADGSLIPLTMEGQTLSLTLAASDGMLMALPEGVDFYGTAIPDPAPGVNLATLGGVTLTASSSKGEDGFYLNLLVDGQRESTDLTKGWTPEKYDKDVRITMNLGAVRKFNRVDLYPSAGNSFPERFDVLVSEDGISYTTVAKAESCPTPDSCKTLTFDTVKAQYISLDIPQGVSAALSEIEVYNMD